MKGLSGEETSSQHVNSEMSEHVERVSANAPAKGQLNKDKNPELSKSGHSEDFILSMKEATGGF